MYFKTISPTSDHDGLSYIDFLANLNRLLQPKSYFEIGTEFGMSAAQITCRTVCIDPNFRISANILGTKKEIHLFQMKSDEFFAEFRLRHFLPGGPDIAFLDGMHRFEYLLRDFMNTEKCCHSRSIILLHDCLPQNARMALRVAAAGPEDEGPHRFSWTGDVWKIIPILKQHRPELVIYFLDCPPTGLVLITRVRPDSWILGEVYHSVVAQYRDADLNDYGRHELWTKFPTINSRELMRNDQDLTMFFDIY